MSHLQLQDIARNRRKDKKAAAARQFANLISSFANSIPVKLVEISDVILKYSMKSPPPSRHTPTIYFICNDGEVRYVGKSIRIGCRISDHAREKAFDSVFYIARELSNSEALALESFFIRKFKPQLNLDQLFLSDNESERLLGRIESRAILAWDHSTGRK